MAKRARNRQAARAPMPGSQVTNITNRPVKVPLGDAINAITAEVARQQQVVGPYGSGYSDYRWPANDPRNMNEFGPLDPLNPDPLDGARRDTGRVDPRLYQYPYGWNIPGAGQQRLTSFATLRAAADFVDILRQCIEVRKQHVSALKWSWNLDPDLVAQAYQLGGGRQGKEDVEAELRLKFAGEIERLTEFWRQPWKAMDIDFDLWVNMFMEEVLVTDAPAIFPSTTYSGEVVGLEIIDGTTIKPLLDHRGARPTGGFPAYQQLLYGFPRGEWEATYTPVPGREDVQQIEGAFYANQLAYLPQNRRTFTPYGYSPVERALLSAKLYLQRQGWMFAEYEDGSTPLTWLVPQLATSNGAPNAIQMNPQQRNEWEDQINNHLSGQTRQRHRMKVSPPGFMPVQMPGIDERYKPDYDLHLIKLVAGHMGVTSSGLGFSESQGLGNSGLHEGQADVESSVGQKPDARLIANTVNSLSRKWLKAPKELCFTIHDDRAQDEVAADGIADAQLKRGTITLNDDRKRIGKPTYDFPEADRPMVYGPAPVLLDGIEAAAEAAQQQGAMIAEAKAVPAGKAEDKPPAPGEPKPQARPIKKVDSPPDDVAAELATRARWMKRNPNAKREFELSPVAATWLAKAEGAGADPKEPPAMLPIDERWPAWTQDLALITAYEQAISTAAGGAVNAASVAADLLAWVAALPDVPTVDSIKGWLTSTNVDDALVNELSPVLHDLATEGYMIGAQSAEAVTEAVMTGVDMSDPAVRVTVDWSDWTPGDVRAARRVLSADGMDVLLDQLMLDNGVRVSGVVARRLDDIASVLADGIEAGRSADEIARALRGVLDDPKWALRLAWTEMSRAVSAATNDVYRETGTTTKGWLTALDQRVCPVCKGNAEAGYIGVDDLFPSGVLHPPAHPRCRCSLIPGVLDPDDTSWLDAIEEEFERMSDEEAESWAGRKADGSGRNLKRYWTKDPEGLAKWIRSAHPWTTLYRHLRRRMPDRSPEMVRAVTSEWFHAATGIWPGERKGKNPVGKG